MTRSVTPLKKLVCLSLAGLLAGCGSTRADVAATTPSSSRIGASPTQSVVPNDYRAVGESPADAVPRPASAARVLPRRPAPPPSLLSRAPAAPAPLPAQVVAPPAEAPPATRTQSGRIIDEAGQPLVGATVLLKGTAQGASTDANGNYSLEVPMGENTFIFGYGGYEDEVAQAHDGQPLTVTLLPAASQSKGRKRR